MKRSIGVSLVGAVLALGSMNASAVLIGGTEVGGFDTFVGSADLSNSGLDTEAGFISSELGLTVTKDDIWQLQVGTDVQEVCVGTECYVDLGAGSNYSYFLLKFGTSPGYPDHYLYQNDGLGGIQFAVYDRSLNGLGATNCGPSDDQKCVKGLSHVTTSVPEPGSLALLGAALMGLGLMRRRQSA